MHAAIDKMNVRRVFEAVTSTLLIGVWLLMMPATAQSQVKFASGEIELAGIKGGNQVITVEFASDEAQRRQGLMHRKKLVAGTGMLFIYTNEGIRTFWMKNTLIPLDIVFFDGAGRFASLHRDVQPLTLALRRSSAQYVLELNAGEAEKLGIGPETRLLLPLGQWR
tara:strand:+ start:355 stop:852 length:498 start_codon:yes stop_codon:yes gene_type:complete